MHVAKRGNEEIPASSAKTKRGIHTNHRVSSVLQSKTNVLSPGQEYIPQSSRNSEGAWYRYLASFEITGNITCVRLGIGVLEITGNFLQ